MPNVDAITSDLDSAVLLLCWKWLLSLRGIADAMVIQIKSTAYMPSVICIDIPTAKVLKSAPV